jgi:hypothetical protein
MRKREGNRPDRRYAPEGSFSQDALKTLVNQLRYHGSGHHKLHPGDYGFVPSVNPRPAKDVCDDLRPVLIDEATVLFRNGILLGIISRFDQGGVPKYVWAVDADGEVYEAKTKPPEAVYHGYRIDDDEPEMQRYIRDEWNRRCRKS